MACGAGAPISGQKTAPYALFWRMEGLIRPSGCPRLRLWLGRGLQASRPMSSIIANVDKHYPNNAQPPHLDRRPSCRQLLCGFTHAATERLLHQRDVGRVPVAPDYVTHPVPLHASWVLSASLPDPCGLSLGYFPLKWITSSSRSICMFRYANLVYH